MLTPFLFVALSADAFAAPGTPPALSRAFDEVWETWMALKPLDATFFGHPGYDDTLEDVTPAGRRAAEERFKALRRALEAFDPGTLSAEDATSWRLAVLWIDESLERQRLGLHEFDVDPRGHHARLATTVEVSQPMRTEADARALLRRLEAAGPFFDALVVNLREGLAKGRVAARPPVERTVAALEKYLLKPSTGTPFAAAARRLPGDLEAVWLPRVAAVVDSSVFPAYRRYLSFLKDEYLPKSRAERMGLEAIPGGKDAYAFLARYHTTTRMTPRELYELGQTELASIESEMTAIARRRGHSGSLRDFFSSVRADPSNFFETREQLVADAARQVARLERRMPDFFGTLPKAPLEVRAHEEYREKDAPVANYAAPPIDGSRPAVYYINTYQPATRARYGMAALTAHEAIPGHHTQFAVASEAAGLPRFRRHLMSTAYTEGWGLYAERLADEMGVYDDDLSRLGMLSYQAWRAARLVVDTGLHDMGWPRSRAVDFMREHTMLTDAEIATEVDRYIAGPGQALAYKVGQREFESLRAEGARRLGPRFDLKAFHDDVLRGGSLPLSVLRSRLEARWAAAR